MRQLINQCWPQLLGFRVLVVRSLFSPVNQVSDIQTSAHHWLQCHRFQNCFSNFAKLLQLARLAIPGLAECATTGLIPTK
jgi:hypothetical protein